MEEIKTTIDDLILIKPSVYRDERGEFLESYNDKKYPPLIKESHFSQDNLSKSNKHVLRGLRFQLPPYAQGKLVQVLRGCVLDVAVDLRKNSSTFGKYFSVELNEDNKLQFLIEKKDHLGEYTAAKTEGIDVHVMNKISLSRCIDEVSDVK